MFKEEDNERMSGYDIPQLIRLWEQEKLTTEQAVGQLLLQVQNISRRVGRVERQMEAARKKERKTGK